LIERVAASEQFSRSARLRDFLLYVGRQSLKKGSPEIHEQEIGAKVFGRDDSYDRTSDTIVRVNASELRRRVDSYFAQDGANEPLIFEIPRGIYKPVFRWRSPAATDRQSQIQVGTQEATLVSPVSPPSARRYIFFVNIALLCLSIALVTVCIIEYRQIRTMHLAQPPWDGKPAVAAFWTGFLDSHKQTDVVLPDDSVSVVEDITQQPIAFGDYLSRGFERQIQSSDLSTDRKGDVYEILKHNLVAFGAVRAAQLVLGEIPSADPRYLAYSRSYKADDVKSNNVVLIGGQKSEPWDHLFDGQLNFVTDYDYAQPMQVVRNRNPKRGEQSVYGVQGASGELVGYATIAYLPNPSRTGHVIILAGTDSDATGAAAEFLTSEEQMERLRNMLHVKRFPYFELLLKTSRVSGTSFDAECITYRAYP
jgi:hypothetical protein